MPWNSHRVVGGWGWGLKQETASFNRTWVIWILKTGQTAFAPAARAQRHQGNNAETIGTGKANILNLTLDRWQARIRWQLRGIFLKKNESGGGGGGEELVGCCWNRGRIRKSMQIIERHPLHPSGERCTGLRWTKTPGKIQQLWLKPICCDTVAFSQKKIRSTTIFPLTRRNPIRCYACDVGEADEKQESWANEKAVDYNGVDGAWVVRWDCFCWFCSSSDFLIYACRTVVDGVDRLIAELQGTFRKLLLLLLLHLHLCPSRLLWRVEECGLADGDWWVRRTKYLGS